MALSSLQIFDRFLRKVTMGAQAQNVALFNQFAQNALVLEAAQGAEGDVEHVASFKRITNLVRRRDPTSTSAVSAVSLESLVETMVRVGAGTPPIDLSPDQFKWINTKPELVAAMVAKQIAEDTIADMVNAAILCAKTTLLATAAVHHDYGSTGKLNELALNEGSAKFGDRAQAIRCWLIHSRPMHDLYSVAITNTSKLYTSNNVKIVQDGFGRVFVITDAPALMDNPSAPTRYYTLGLTEGAALVRQNDDFTSNIDTSNGLANIVSTLQASWSYGVGVKGFSYDKATGGAAPNDAALGSSANWTQYAQSHKDLAGVIVTSQ